MTVPFTYDVTAATLTGQLRNTAIALRKVSDHEPPDLLARARQEADAEKARWQKSRRSEQRMLPSRQALRVLLETIVAAPDPAQRPESVFLATSDNRGQLNRSGFNATWFIAVALENREVARPSGYPLESKLLNADAVSDLPLTYALPAADRTRLTQLAQNSDLKIETHVFSQISAFPPESLHRTLQLSVPPDAQLGPPAVLEQVLDIIWDRWLTAITATLHYRVPSPP